MPEISLLSTEDDVAAFLRRIEPAVRIALDTEFVPEYSYLPHLCLIQVATDDEIAIIDPLAAGDLANFWDAITQPEKEIVIHGGKEEVMFCRQYAGRVPSRAFDVQLASGLVGMGYPLGYSQLVWRVLGAHVGTTQARTDWRKRPLGKVQIEYAANDVKHLFLVREKLGALLAEMGRVPWFDDEMSLFVEQARPRQATESWRRVSGHANLNPRGLAVLRELAAWREERAGKLDKPLKWILRDDQLIELARRQPSNIEELEHTRGIGNVREQRWSASLLDAIRRGKNMPEAECPQRKEQRELPEEQMLQKLLAAAMIQIARDKSVAPTLLGTSADAIDLMRWVWRGEPADRAPRLARGWRAKVCGQSLRDLILGNAAIRIAGKGTDANLVIG